MTWKHQASRFLIHPPSTVTTMLPMKLLCSCCARMSNTCSAIDRRGQCFFSELKKLRMFDSRDEQTHFGARGYLSVRTDISNIMDKHQLIPFPNSSPRSFQQLLAYNLNCNYYIPCAQHCYSPSLQLKAPYSYAIPNLHGVFLMMVFAEKTLGLN